MNYPALPRIAEHANRYFDVAVYAVTMLLDLTAALVILSHLTDLNIALPRSRRSQSAEHGSRNL